MRVIRNLVKQLDAFELAVVLLADLHLETVEVALKGDRFVDFELAEKERGYAWTLIAHGRSGVVASSGTNS